MSEAIKKQILKLYKKKDYQAEEKIKTIELIILELNSVLAERIVKCFKTR